MKKPKPLKMPKAPAAPVQAKGFAPPPVVKVNKKLGGK